MSKIDPDLQQQLWDLPYIFRAMIAINRADPEEIAYVYLVIQGNEELGYLAGVELWALEAEKHQAAPRFCETIYETEVFKTSIAALKAAIDAYKDGQNSAGFTTIFDLSDLLFSYFEPTFKLGKADERN